MKKPSIRNFVTKNMFKLQKGAGAHIKTEKAIRRSEEMALKQELAKALKDDGSEKN